MKNMGDYHDHYLKTDVLLLADIFEIFINRSLEFYKLDPSYCFSSPGLSWDAMLKTAEIKLELISDIGKYYFVEKGLRGGISYISKRFSEANNKCMKNYDLTKESKYVRDIDANNLSGCVMSRYLPYGEFKWVKNVDAFDVNSISKNSPYCHILKVDLEYPDELHNLHNDYPLAAENLEITYDMFSNYCKKIANKYSIKVGGIKQLVPNLSKETNHTVHYINLQLYLSLGIKLIKIKIFKILKFKQSDWVKKYIDLNMLANQLLFLKKFLVKILLLFMILNLS